ncbi:MAG: ABC transporter ATP-binding protein [Bacilli bacterium]|nr:ABC transporter ATP-binding protein [Bacilli bacterium]
MDEELEYEELDDQPEKLNTSIWVKILKLVLKKKSSIILMIISVILLACLDVLTPYLNSQVIDVFFRDNPDFSKKWFYIGLYVFGAFMYMITIFTFIRQAGHVEVEVGYEVRKEAFDKLQELPFSYYDKTPSGWIMARLTSDSRKLSEIISWGIVDLFWSVFTMLGVLIMIYITNWKLALIITFITPIMFLVCVFFTKTILNAYRNVRKTNSKITGSFNESILGAKTTKALCLEESRYKEFSTLTSTMKKDSLKAILRSSLFWPIVLVMGYIGVGITLSVGGAGSLGMIENLNVEPEVLFLFISYTLLFFDPVMQIARVLSDMQQAQASAERIISLIETPIDIYDTEEVKSIYGTILSPKRENWEDLEGYVEFNHVTFSYTQKEVVLKDFNLKVNKGEVVALVGTTGAGKSTIVNLLCRFYEPTSGEILIDGKNYKERSINWLHEKLGYVLQTPHLFNGSIKENIAYGKMDASMDEIIEAAKKAQAHEFIMKLKDGYDTSVGEGGAKLSLGERQLISFARAIIKNPKILILDEATSSIDTETEVLIQDVMNNFMKGRTTFIVAHRLSTIINADKILVISNGEIKESGTHKELLKQEGIYYNLYKNQFINEQMDKSIK